MSRGRLAAFPLVLGAVLAACSSAGRAPGTDALERGDAAFRSGDYAAAARAYETHLARGSGPDVDQAVSLRLAVIYLVLGTPETDPARAEATLERMIRDHPEGRLREVAETILSLRARIAAEARRSSTDRESRAALEARIQELERRIEALKTIDLESRRRPD